VLESMSDLVKMRGQINEDLRVLEQESIALAIQLIESMTGATDAEKRVMVEHQMVRQILDAERK
jgi:hypothetical protein